MGTNVRLSDTQGYLIISPGVPKKLSKLQLVMGALGARWYKKQKVWKIPNLQMNRVVLEPIFKRHYKLALPPPAGPRHLFRDQEDHLVFESRYEDLFEYQKQAVLFLINSPLPGTLVHILPGQGKTVVITVALDVLAPRDVLIICPRILVETWRREINDWTSGRISLTNCYGLPPPERTGKWVVTTYETVRGTYSRSYLRKWDLIVLDESIRVKNRGTQTFNAVNLIRKKNPYAVVWEASGLPISRFTDDLWGQFHILWPGAFTSYWRFANRYCHVEEAWGRRSYTVTGNQELTDFSGDFGDLMLSLNGSGELNLPDLEFIVYDIELTPEQHRIHHELLSAFIAQLKDGTLIAQNKLSQIIRLQQVLSSLSNVSDVQEDSAKITAALELIASEAVETPTLIWTYWRGTGQQLYREMSDGGLNVGLILGGTDAGLAQEILDQYTSGKLEYLILSLGVGKHGLTLTNTKTVIYIDLSTHFDAVAQSLYRVKRIGLEHTPRIISLKATNTIDEWLHLNLHSKVTGLESLADEDLLEFLEGLL